MAQNRTEPNRVATKRKKFCCCTRSLSQSETSSLIGGAYLCCSLAVKTARTRTGSPPAVRYLDQDYEALKRRCLETGRLFPALGSLGVNELGPNSYKVRGVSWQRPTVSSDSVQFIRTEIDQVLLEPVQVNQNRRRLRQRKTLPLLLKSAETGPEFWFWWEYRSPWNGSTTEDFEDFTGGIAEKALGRGSLMGRSINVSEPPVSRPTLMPVKGHAYSVTGADQVEYQGDMEKLIWIRNPWGQVEWTGAWSDKRCRTSEVLMNLSVLDVFLRHYSHLEICNLTPDALSNDDVSKWAFSCGSPAVRGVANAVEVRVLTRFIEINEDDGFRRLFGQLAGQVSELQRILNKVVTKRKEKDGSGKLGLNFLVSWQLLGRDSVSTASTSSSVCPRRRSSAAALSAA
uniref:Calpain catalytic domain-containing protein n=1 Tax=Xiphophorus couchianus TaxID=32473 RepID=A0A3B5M0N7_9TELE